MDAHALLTSQGWRGSGHSLHLTSDSTGLRRPLLVSQKQNVLGIGKKQHHTSDMWWQNAFDKSLAGLDTSKEGEVIQTITNGNLDMVAKGGGKYVGKEGLYSCFVRGEGLAGSLTPDGYEGFELGKEKKSDGSSKRRKIEGESKAERRARKDAKKVERAARAEVEHTPQLPTSTSASDGEDVDMVVSVVESKEERRARKENRRARRAAKELQSTTQLPTPTSNSEEENVEEIDESTETKAERTERRRLKKLAKVAEATIVTSSIPEEQKKKKKKRID